MDIRYIVFEESGSSPNNYRVAEEGFEIYSDALERAMMHVKKYAECYENVYIPSVVIIFDNDTGIIGRPRSRPCGRVVFEWHNHKPV